MRSAVFSAISFVLVLVLVPACKDKSSAGAAPTSSASATVSAVVQPSSRLQRDDTGHLHPRTPRPQDNPADLPPAPTHELDWDLDKADPARDYAERYVRATLRYGADTSCVEGKLNGQSGGKAVIEIVGAKKEGCPAPSADAREVLLVDVQADRLESKKGAPLGKWPDGSDPGAPPAASPVEAEPFASPLKDALFAMQLTPIRGQLYGRGSYLVVTLAGWHAPVTVNAPAESLKPFAQKMCVASNGLPFALVAGIDRSTVLRVTCPGSARWDKL